jgi:hypothetical protein
MEGIDEKFRPYLVKKYGSYCEKHPEWLMDNKGFKPDYGLRLMNQGLSKDVDLQFYDFRLWSLTVLGRGQYSTMVEMPYAGELHALSFDFNQSQFEQIISKAKPQLIKYIRSELARDPSSPRTIDFDGEVVFGVRSRLGELQKVQ